MVRIGRPGRRSLGPVTGAKPLEVLFAEGFSNWIQKIKGPILVTGAAGGAGAVVALLWRCLGGLPTHLPVRPRRLDCFAGDVCRGFHRRIHKIATGRVVGATLCWVPPT